MRSFLFLSLALARAAFSSVFHDTTCTPGGPVDCLQSQWSEWMQVSFNTQYRTRTILLHPLNGGFPCGPNEETRQLPGSAGVNMPFLRSQTTLTRDPARERDLLVILDESGSLGSVNFESTKEALATVLGNICPGIGPSYPYNQVAFMTFSTSVREHFDFDDYGTYEGVRNAIMQVPYAGGGTETQLALHYARTTMFANGAFSTSTKGLRRDSLKEVLLITDGLPSDPAATVAAAQRLRNIGVDVFALGIGTGIDYNHMSQLISSPQYQHIFHLDSFCDFHALADSIQGVANSMSFGLCVNFNPWATGRRR